jgi:hypothetical protein
MPGKRKLIPLMFRADWGSLSLSAEVTGMGPDPVHLLIAPGDRFREEAAGMVLGCDGAHRWAWPAPGKQEFDLHPPIANLLCPSQLLAGHKLKVRGQTSACGRDAWSITAWPRSSSMFVLYDRVQATVDAELGILLSREEFCDGEQASLVTVTDLRLNPPEANDQDRFTAPPGSVPLGTFSALFSDQALTAAKAVASVASGGLGLAIRCWPFDLAPRQSADDPEPDPPQDDPGGHGVPPDAAAPGDLLLLALYRSGAAKRGFSATVHQWDTPAGAVELLRATAGRAGIGGLNVLADAFSRGRGTHSVVALRFGDRNRYQVEYRLPRSGPQPKMTTCDGEQRWREYDDRVAVGPATRLPVHLMRSVDASWLLGRRLSAQTETVIDGRRAFRVQIAPATPTLNSIDLFPSRAEAVVDAELGILLRYTQYGDGEVATRVELRDVTTGTDSDFGVEIPAGIRVVHDAGDFLDEVPVPDPVKSAARAAASAVRWITRS